MNRGLICAGAWHFPVVKSLRIPGANSSSLLPNALPNALSVTLPNALPNALPSALPNTLHVKPAATPDYSASLTK